VRIALLITVATFCLIGTVAAQTTNDVSIPRRIGNRANGFSYQPTPREVVSKEKAAGVRPSTASQQATNQELGDIDRRLLHEEGLSTSSVPRLAPR
jgi:hypothetical protein